MAFSRLHGSGLAVQTMQAAGASARDANSRVDATPREDRGRHGFPPVRGVRGQLASVPTGDLVRRKSKESPMLRTAARTRTLALAIAASAITALGVWGARLPATEAARASSFDAAISDHSRKMLDEGRRIFRFDTFGDEDFWGGTLRLHDVVAQLSPRDALGLGLKVDAGALTEQQLSRLRQGRINLDDPAVTAQLLRQNAILGVTGFFAPDGRLRTVGLQCALCHSTVDDSVAPGVGRRLDGWANQDLNVGGIIAA